MDEKGFLLGLSNKAKVIVRRGRRQPARETQDGSREWITVVETCCAMASSAYLSWMATELTTALTLSAMPFKIRLPSSHILDTPPTSVYSHLQKAYGTAVHTHTRETQTGITKKLFFSFYSQAKRIAYTRANIKAAWRATGIQPYNPDAVLQPLLQKLKQSQSPRSSDGRHVQRPTSTPSKILAWQTSRNRCQLRHQTNAAIDILSLAKTGASAIDLIRELSQQTEAALARAEIAEIETANLRTKYAGK